MSYGVRFFLSLLNWGSAGAWGIVLGDQRYHVKLITSDEFNVAKCNLGEVKLKQVRLQSSLVAVCDMRELQDFFGGL